MKRKNLYISSHEKSSGTIVIAMGMMEFLKSKFKKVAIFRPFIKDSQIDYDINFLIKRYSLDIAYRDCIGFTIIEVERIIAQNQFDTLIKDIIAKIKELESRYDFVLIEGLSQSYFSNSIDFDINLEVAKNLGSAYINIIKGYKKSIDEILDDISIDYKRISSVGCEHFATFINRVDSSIVSKLKELFKLKKFSSNIFILEEVNRLDMPTIREVKNSLNAKIIKADSKDLDRLIQNKKIAAMQLENFLDYIRDGDLIISPVDRADILVGSILAIFSKRYSNLSGIILTGRLSLSDSIIKLLDGFDNLPLPILWTKYNTYETAIRISEVSSIIDIRDERKIALALGLFNSSVDMNQLEELIYKSSVDILTPAMFEFGLFQRAKSNKKRVVLPEALDDRILRATEILLFRDVVDITLLGEREEILQKSASLNLDISKAEIINPISSKYRKIFAQKLYDVRKAKGMSPKMAFDIVGSLNYFGTMMVYLGYADGMVSGAVHTTQETIRPALQIIKTEPNIPIISSLFFMSLDTKVLVYADCAVNQDPTADELATIAITTADTAIKFGITPKIAMLSYSTGPSGKGKDVEKVAKATEIVKSKRADLLIEGPIQYDAAIDRDVAKKKLPNSKVAGEATIFIFPDLNTGNNTYKAVQRTSGAVAIGPILQGLKKPINDLSRGCLVSDIINTVAITAIQAIKE